MKYTICLLIQCLILCSSILLCLSVGPTKTNNNEQTSMKQPDLKTQETFDSYSGALGPLRAHLDYPLEHEITSGMGGGGSDVIPGSYDDFHKYGGIGKNILGSPVYGSEGYKHYYGDSEHSDQGLNKYSGHHKRDKYGGKSGNHKDYHDTHVYTRNRGYGYEKHYMYDKEYSTGKSIGTHNGHHSYYGDHDHGSKLTIDAHKNYESKKFGGKTGHSSHADDPVAPVLVNDYAPAVLVDGGHDFGKGNLLKHKKELHQLKKHLIRDHHNHYNHLSPPITYTKVQEYVPVIDSYGGVLAHGPSAVAPPPTYGTTIIETSDPHLSPYSQYPPPAYIQSHLPDEGIYLSSASNAQKVNNRNQDTEGESVNTLSPGPSSKSSSSTNNNKVINTSPLISTRMTSITAPAPVATVAESFQRIQSAVHATPPVVIATHHYHRH